MIVSEKNAICSQLKHILIFKITKIMGFFSKLLSTAGVSVSKPIINNEQEAFLTIVVAAGSADGDIEGEEWDTIYDTLYQKKMFHTVDIYALINECKTNIKAYESLATAVDECSPMIKAENRDMLFAVCTDLVLIDGYLTANEEAIIEHLKNSLGVSDDLAMKTVEVMLVRNKGNV